MKAYYVSNAENYISFLVKADTEQQLAEKIYKHYE